MQRTAVTRLISDSLWAGRLWRVWTFLGVQDVRTRFRRSLIGPAWLLINLGLFIGGAGVVYGIMFRQPMTEFLPYLTTGLVLWNFLLSSLTEAGMSFVNAEGYIKQFAYPKQIYLLRTLVALSSVLAVGLAALAVLLLLMGKFDIVGWLYAIPGMILLAAAALSHITIVAYTATRFRDLPHALTGVFQVLFFITPIMFPASILQDRGLELVYLFNPLYYLIDVVRFPILEQTFAPWSHYLFALCYIAVCASIGLAIARRLDDRIVFLL